MVDYHQELQSVCDTHVDTISFTSPGLYYSHEQWLNLKDKLSDPFFAELHERNLQAITCLENECNGEDICDVPIKLGAQPADYGYPGVWASRVLKNIICRNVAAWYVTEDQRFLNNAIRALDECCIRPKEWHPDAAFMGLHGANLNTGDMLFALSFGFDALMPYLSDNQKERYADCLIHHGLAAYHIGIEEKDWWIENCYNWNPSLHGNAGIAALVLLQFNEQFARATLRTAIPCLAYNLPKYLEGGGYSEGPMYQCTAIGHLSDFVIPWFRATGNDLGLSEHQGFIDTLMIWPYLVGGDGRTLNVSNCDEFGIEYSIAQAAWWSRTLNKPEILGYHHQMMRPWNDTHQLFYDVEFFWHQEAHQPVANPDTNGLKHFHEIDWLSYQHDDLWMFVTAGWNGGGHHNQDQGHFILGLGDDRFLCDPGYGQGANSQHNTVSVGGNTCPNATCPITKIEEHENGFYACVDLQPGFPYRVRFFNRHIVVIGKNILVLDDAAGAIKEWSSGFKEESFVDANWFWQTRQPVTLEQSRAVLNGRKDQLSITALSPINKIECKEWNYDGPIRTLHWREHHNMKRSIHPTFLSFDGSECDWQQSAEEHVFRINQHSIRFSVQDGVLAYAGIS